jgi:hypothetical protein
VADFGQRLGQRQSRLDGYAQEVEQRGQVAPHLGDELGTPAREPDLGCEEAEHRGHSRDEQPDPAGEHHSREEPEGAAHDR